MSRFIFQGGIDVFAVECLVNRADGTLKTFVFFLADKSGIPEFLFHLFDDDSGVFIGQLVF